MTLWAVVTLVFLADVSFQGSENVTLSGKTHLRQKCVGQANSRAHSHAVGLRQSGPPAPLRQTF